MLDNSLRNSRQDESATTTLGSTGHETVAAISYPYVIVAKGAVDLHLKLVDTAQENVVAAFDFARELPTVKSPSVFLELSSAHAHRQFESFAKQTEHLAGLAQKAIMETALSWQSIANRLYSSLGQSQNT
jgi:hypothetical protein